MLPNYKKKLKLGISKSNSCTIQNIEIIGEKAIGLTFGSVINEN